MYIFFLCSFSIYSFETCQIAAHIIKLHKSNTFVSETILHRKRAINVDNNFKILVFLLNDLVFMLRLWVENVQQK